MRLAYILACALPLFACTESLPSGDSSFAEPDLSGSLRVPLTAEDAAGNVYRLRNVDLEITGSALLSISDRDGVRARESLITQLPAGEYTVYLRPGWRLMARDGAGRETSTEAELLSANPFTLRVNQLGDETLGLVFRHDDKQLRFGPGSSVRVTSVEPTTNPNTL
ncbi:MAG: hypothetical protein QM778_37485 [Myxococcales bacterium]